MLSRRNGNNINELNTIRYRNCRATRAVQEIESALASLLFSDFLLASIPSSGSCNCVKTKVSRNIRKSSICRITAFLAFTNQGARNRSTNPTCHNATLRVINIDEISARGNEPYREWTWKQRAHTFALFNLYIYIYKPSSLIFTIKYREIGLDCIDIHVCPKTYENFITRTGIKPN